jgi:hypothetical protein
MEKTKTNNQDVDKANLAFDEAAYQQKQWEAGKTKAKSKSQHANSELRQLSNAKLPNEPSWEEVWRAARS